jgi:hypothetical protein
MQVRNEQAVQLRIQWPTFCRIACKALVLGTDFEHAAEYLTRGALQMQKMQVEINAEVKAFQRKHKATNK